MMTLSESATISFDLRGHRGRVSIRYGVNEDPAKLGFPLLGLGFEPDAPRGFPVVEAHVEFGGEGYVGILDGAPATELQNR
jgi:hypothetical protein